MPRHPDRRPERAVAHRPVDRVPWVRQSPADLGGRIEHGRGGRAARDRPPGAPSQEPRRARRGLPPGRPPRRRRLGPDREPRRRADRLGDAGAAGPRPRTGGRSQIRSDDRPLVLHRPIARRRERRRQRGHVRHGPGRADDLRPDRGAGARRAARMGPGRHGRHRRRPVRPADVGESVVRPDGQLRPPRVPGRPGQDPGHGGATRVGRGGRRRGVSAARSGSATASCRSATS